MQHVPKVELLIVVDYGTVTPLQRLLPEFEAEIMAEEYDVDVTYRVSLPAERAAALQAKLIELTNGQVLLDLGGT